MIINLSGSSVVGGSGVSQQPPVPGAQITHDAPMEDLRPSSPVKPISKEEAVERLKVTPCHHTPTQNLWFLTLLMSFSHSLSCTHAPSVFLSLSLFLYFLSQETEKIIAELNETWEDKLRKTESIRLER